MTNLSAILEEAMVRLEPLASHHVEPLRAACAADQEIWEIYPISMLDEHFDRSMDALHKATNWVRFVAINTETNMVVGMCNFINADTANGVVEIGGTYIAPSVRGVGFNGIMKKLLINHAFSNDFRKVEFRVDGRNKRSMAAVLKLGATHEGTLRKNRITWTGYERDTEVFGLLKEEWDQ